MKKTLLASLIGATALVSVANAAEAPLVKELSFEPKALLVVGNSYMYYNCGLNGYLGGMIREQINPKIKTRIATIGRGNQSQYPIEEYLDNAKSLAHNKKCAPLDPELMKKEIKKREKYDLVLMQGSNRGADDQARDAHYVKLHAEAIRANGGEPAMIMTWTQKKKNAPAFEVVRDGVTKIANDNKMMVIPVGLAFNRVEKQYPDLKLIMPDNTHPTAIGSYLMASTIYASIYKRDPMEAKGFAGGCEKPIDPAVREKLHKAAWETAKEWYGWK